MGLLSPVPSPAMRPSSARGPYSVIKAQVPPSFSHFQSNPSVPDAFIMTRYYKSCEGKSSLFAMEFTKRCLWGPQRHSCDIVSEQEELVCFGTVQKL